MNKDNFDFLILNTTYENEFFENFIKTRLDDVEKRTIDYILKNNSSKLRLTHSAFRSIACKLFLKREIPMVLKFLEARGFLEKNHKYIYIKAARLADL